LLVRFLEDSMRKIQAMTLIFGAGYAGIAHAAIAVTTH
jgi:hypothetical protein